MVYGIGRVLFWLSTTCVTVSARVGWTVGTPTTIAAHRTDHIHLISSPPFALRQGNLQRIDVSSDTVCGAATKATNYLITCGNHERCTHTFIKQETTHNAYLYCSPTSPVPQKSLVIYTTGASNWGANESCPLSTNCCTGYLSLMLTEYYIKSGYTATNFDCTNAPPLIATYIAQKNVIDPTKFSAEMSKFSSHAFLSSRAKIGIGIGVGVGALVLCIVGMLFWLRWRRIERNRANLAAAQVSDTAALAGKEDSYELSSTAALPSEAPSTELAHEMPTHEPQELATDWQPSELRSASK